MWQIATQHNKRDNFATWSSITLKRCLLHNNADCTLSLAAPPPCLGTTALNKYCFKQLAVTAVSDKIHF